MYLRRNRNKYYPWNYQTSCGYYDAISGLTYALTKSKDQDEKKQMKKIFKRNKSVEKKPIKEEENINLNLDKMHSQQLEPKTNLNKIINNSNFDNKHLK